MESRGACGSDNSVPGASSFWMTESSNEDFRTAATYDEFSALHRHIFRAHPRISNVKLGVQSSKPESSYAINSCENRAGANCLDKELDGCSHLDNQDGCEDKTVPQQTFVERTIERSPICSRDNFISKEEQQIMDDILDNGELSLFKNDSDASTFYSANEFSQEFNNESRSTSKESLETTHPISGQVPSDDVASFKSPNYNKHSSRVETDFMPSTSLVARHSSTDSDIVCIPTYPSGVFVQCSQLESSAATSVIDSMPQKNGMQSSLEQVVQGQILCTESNISKSSSCEVLSETVTRVSNGNKHQEIDLRKELSRVMELNDFQQKQIRKMDEHNKVLLQEVNNSQHDKMQMLDQTFGVNKALLEQLEDITIEKRHIEAKCNKLANLLLRAANKKGKKHQKQNCPNIPDDDDIQVNMHNATDLEENHTSTTVLENGYMKNNSKQSLLKETSEIDQQIREIQSKSVEKTSQEGEQCIIEDNGTSLGIKDEEFQHDSVSGLDSRCNLSTSEMELLQTLESQKVNIGDSYESQDTCIMKIVSKLQQVEMVLTNHKDCSNTRQIPVCVCCIKMKSMEHIISALERELQSSKSNCAILEEHCKFVKSEMNRLMLELNVLRAKSYEQHQCEDNDEEDNSMTPPIAGWREREYIT